MGKFHEYLEAIKDEDDIEDLLDEGNEILFHLQKEQSSQQEKRLIAQLKKVEQKLDRINKKEKSSAISNLLNKIDKRIG